MAAESDQPNKICTHCDRAIPSANMDLHYAHCVRNLERCKVCGDMVPKKLSEEHYLNTHAPVSCSQCSETMQRDILDIHKGESCPQRMATCEFCDFPLPVVDLTEHQDVCGNRTELCQHCAKYVRLREIYSHESLCDGVGSSRDAMAAGRGRRQPTDFPRRGILFTIALTGIAVLLGSLFFQRKTEGSQVN